jgi:hypothetical protein
MQEYSHTQKSPLDDLLFLVAAAAGVAAWAFRHDPPLCWLLAMLAMFMGLVALCFGYLTVTGDRDGLTIRYGPLPVIHTFIPYSKISAVEPGRSAFIDGLGVHWIPWRGWTYNLWGADCVELSHDGQIIRVGSDDVPNLVSFLRLKIGSQ